MLGYVWMHDVSLWDVWMNSVFGKSWFCHVSQWLLRALPHLVFLPSFNPLYSCSKSSHSLSSASLSTVISFPLVLFILVLHLSSLFISLFEDLVFSNHLSAIIYISSLPIKSLLIGRDVFFSVLNITICLSGIILISLIWWLNSYTHIVLIRRANGTAAVDSQLRWWDVEELCSSLSSSSYVAVCAAESDLPREFPLWELPVVFRTFSFRVSAFVRVCLFVFLPSYIWYCWSLRDSCVMQFDRCSLLFHHDVTFAGRAGTCVRVLLLLLYICEHMRGGVRRVKVSEWSRPYHYRGFLLSRCNNSLTLAFKFSNVY